MPLGFLEAFFLHGGGWIPENNSYFHGKLEDYQHDSRVSNQHDSCSNKEVKSTSNLPDKSNHDVCIYRLFSPP